MNFRKNSSGITLIALVITIIVLLILAGVSLSLVAGSNGILGKASGVVDKTKIASAKEQVELKIAEFQQEFYEAVYVNNEADVNTKKGKWIADQTKNKEQKTEDYKFTITGDNAPYKVTIIQDSTLETAIEGKLTEDGILSWASSGTGGSTYNNPYIPVGFEHIGTADWNSGYKIKETATGNIFVWVPCVTDQSKVKAGDTVQTFKKTLPTPKEDGTLDTTDPYYMYNKNNLTITGDESPADAIETSVGTYGGFYIAAYEAGVPLDNDKNEIEPASATTSQKARSVAGAKAWTNIKRTNAITAATNMIDASSGVKSGLISGKCWDTTLQWMAHSSTNAENEPNAGYDTDSSGNGWYKDVSNNAKITTGQYPINNIYDMAGNVWEWTTENCTNNGNSCLVRSWGRSQLFRFK